MKESAYYLLFLIMAVGSQCTYGSSTTFPPYTTETPSFPPENTENPTKDVERTKQNFIPLRRAALVAVITVAVVSCLALILCSGVITGSIIQREVGRRTHRRRRRTREWQRHQARTGNLQRGQQRRLWFAMRTNEAYEVTPYHSTTTLGQEPSYLEPTSDVYYEDITPFTKRISQTITTNT